MFKFLKDNEKIFFTYTPETFEIEDTRWPLKNILEEEVVCYNGVRFKKDDLINYSTDEITFRFASIQEDYYKISNYVIDTEYDFYLHKDIAVHYLDKYIFYAKKNDNILSTIEKVLSYNEPVYIGGEKSICSLEDFYDICHKFPNAYERNLYYNSRVESVICNYFEKTKGFIEKHERYVDKKLNNNTNFERQLEDIKSNELLKYINILDLLNNNLKNSKNVTEEEWKKLMCEILLLLFPKYINYHKEFKVYLESNDRKKKYEQFDFLLVKSNGAVDVLEVKRPDCPSIISSSTDHDNYYQTNTFSKVAMQTQKYINNINRNVLTIEKNMLKKYKDEYDDDFNFRINNPKGIIIIGYSKNYNIPQRNDLEIIRRMYSDISEVFTYDDIIEMIERQINMLRRKGGII